MVLLLRHGSRAALALLVGLFWGTACATGGDHEQGTGGPVLEDAGGDVFLVEGGGGASDGRDEAPSGLNPLCLPNTCPNGVPDDVSACEGVVPPPAVPDAAAADGSDEGGAPSKGEGGPETGVGPTDGGSGDSGALGDAAVDGAFGADDAAADAAPPEDSSSDAGGDATSSDFDTESGFDARSGDVPVYACHITRDGSGTASRCEFAGRGQVQAPCTSSRDCAPGLACVAEASEGQCLPMCCRADACKQGTFCTERALRGEPGASPVLVPVCVAAMACRLDDPYPCESNDRGACSCPPDTACSVVKSDGTASCVPPGQGEAGDPCPCEEGEMCLCAPGFMCDRASNRCVKICHTNRQTNAGECGSGLCQAAANLPNGFGVCVGMVYTAR